MSQRGSSITVIAGGKYGQQCEGRPVVPLKFTVTMARSVPGSVAWLMMTLRSGDFVGGKTTTFHGGLSVRESKVPPRTIIVTVSVAVDTDGSNTNL